MHRLAGVGSVGDGITAYRKLTMLNAYGRAASTGHNPNWDMMGYPGPPVIATTARARLATGTAALRDGVTDLRCDVVVVGSGAGGAAVAAVAARQLWTRTASR